MKRPRSTIRWIPPIWVVTYPVQFGDGWHMQKIEVAEWDEALKFANKEG